MFRRLYLTYLGDGQWRVESQPPGPPWGKVRPPRNAMYASEGNAAGAFISSTKRAKNKTATTIEYQIDDRGSYRATLDHNQVLKKDLLALRYSGVYEALNSFRIPTESFQRRHFVALNLTPFKRTALRANFEKGLINAPAVRPGPDYDAVSPWLAAGSPMIETFINAAGGKPPGTQNYGQAGLLSTEFTVGGTSVPTQRFTNSGQSAPTTFANGFPVNGASFRSLVNDDIYPTFASNFGNSAFRLTDDKTHSVFYPLISVDTRDGRHTPDVAVYTLKEPRTFQITNSFRF